VAVPEPLPAPPVSPSGTAAPPAADASPALAAIVASALEYRGVPYRNGGSTPDGFDCSGLVQWVFARHGIRLPREVHDQFRVGREVEREDVQPGDLLFFDTLSGGASHVGIALGGDQFVHAPSSRGVVRVERLSIDYWKKRWLGARRVAE
jgi:peptidoglycan DL-endopeptidase CwlO